MNRFKIRTGWTKLAGIVTVFGLAIGLGLALAGSSLAAEESAVDASTAPADPLRPPAVRTQEVPVVPPTVMQRLSQYANVRSASFAGFAPDGSGILIGTRFGDTTQLHRVYAPGGRREQISFFDEPVRGSFVPKSPDNSVFVVMSSGGNENYQVHLMNGKSLAHQRLTDGTSRNQLQAVSDDGKQVVIASNRRNGRDTDLYTMSLDQPEYELVFKTDGEFWYAADWSSDGRYLLLGRYVSINEGYVAILDLESGAPKPIALPDGRTGGISALAFSADAKSVLMAVDTHGEYRQLARYNLQDESYEWISDKIPHDVSALTIDKERGTVAFAVNQDGASRVYLLKNGKPAPLDLPLGIVSGLEFSPDGLHLGMTLSRPNAPSDAYTLQLDSGELTRWTFSEVGGLDASKFVVPDRIQFKSFDGRMIPAYYFKAPKAEGRSPVVISIHGGPESQYRPYFRGSTQYYLNELNVSVISPNVRGSAGYGKTYLKLDNGPLREDSVKDIGALLDWIKAQPELDADRIAVTGGSYGGYMVLASLVHYGDRIKAGVDIVGIASFTTFLQRTAPYRQDLRRAEYGDERDPEMQKVFARINPTANADKIRSALLVAHGVNDPRVPFFEAEQIAEKVRAQGRPVWTVYAENEGHGFRKKPNRDYLSAVQAMFIAEHLSTD